MKNIEEIIKKFDEEFEDDLKYFKHTGLTMTKLDFKSFLRQSIKEALESCVPEEKEVPKKIEFTMSNLHLIFDSTQKAGFNVCRQEIINNIKKYLGV